MNQPVKLVLLDIDGTLLHSKGLGRRVMKSALLSTYGTAGSIDQCAVGGRSYLQIVEDALTGSNITREQILAKWQSYNEQVEKELETIITREPGWIYPLPGGIELLRSLSEIPTVVPGLITGNPAAPSWIKLRAAGYLKAWFKINVFGDEAQSRDELVSLARKRAYDVYHVRFEGSNTVIIGDTLNDVECARRSGARSIIVLTGYDREQDLRASQPHFIFNDLTDYPAIQAAIFASE